MKKTKTPEVEFMMYKLINTEGPLNMREIEDEKNRCVDALTDYIKLLDLKGMTITINEPKKGIHRIEEFTTRGVRRILETWGWDNKKKKKSGQKKRKRV